MREVTPAHLLHAQVPKRYWSATLADLSTLPRYQTLLENYTSHLAQMEAAGFCLVLHGSRVHEQELGAGVLARAVLGAGRSWLTISADRLQHMVVSGETSTKDEIGNAVPVLEHARTVDFLWLRGLGMEYTPGGDSFIGSLLANLLHERAAWQRPTVITTGLGLRDLALRYGPSVGSLLNQPYTGLFEVGGHAAR